MKSFKFSGKWWLLGWRLRVGTPLLRSQWPPVSGVTADEVAHITAYVRKQQRMVGIQ
jgi:hypothetical protein